MVWIDGVEGGALEVVDFTESRRYPVPIASRSPLVQPAARERARPRVVDRGARALLIATHDHDDGFLVRHGVVLEAEATEQTSSMRL